jgi:hypothetical protein
MQQQSFSFAVVVFRCEVIPPTHQAFASTGPTVPAAASPSVLPGPLPADIEDELRSSAKSPFLPANERNEPGLLRRTTPPAALTRHDRKSQIPAVLRWPKLLSPADRESAPADRGKNFANHARA